MIIKMILTNGFDPDPRVYKEAKALVKKGYDVEILCWDRDNRYLDKPIEVIEGIKIKRFFHKSKYGSGYRQIVSYFNFITEIKKYLKRKEYDIIHGHDIDGVFAGCFVKKNKKLIWDMHEMYDGFNYRLAMKYAYEMIANKCFEKADGIIYVSNLQKKRYENKVSKDITQEVIANTPEKSIFNGFERVMLDKLRISFIGSVRDYNSLKLLMDVGEKFSNVVIKIHGAGVAYNDLYSISHRYKNTIITGKFHYKDIKKLYENSDLIYAVYNSKLDNVKFAFPVKGFEAIITETPVITNKGTYFGEFVEKNDIGFTINEETEQDLINVIKKILNDTNVLRIKSNNMKKIKKDYYWEKQSEKLVRFYERLLANSK